MSAVFLIFAALDVLPCPHCTVLSPGATGSLQQHVEEAGTTIGRKKVLAPLTALLAT
ncbi:MAG TPA: hypothetical protein VJY65_02550 [Chloroflexota bacterium]|nr:hypothetical protein [Chloroflexota bacterium]